MVVEVAAAAARRQCGCSAAAVRLQCGGDWARVRGQDSEDGKDFEEGVGVGRVCVRH